MLIRNSIFAIGLVAFTFPSAYAQDGSAPDTKQNNTAEAAPPSQPASDGSSAGARVGKMGGAELGYGLFVGVIPGIQFHGYYNISPDLSVGLLYNSGSLDLAASLPDEDTVKTEEASLSASILGVNARWFAGNSFYLMGALAQRTISAKFDIQSEVIDYGLEGTIEATTLAAVLGIGNQWQWDSGFSFGVEWLGYALALSSSSSGSLDETGSAAGIGAEETKDDLDELGEDSEDLADVFGKASTARLFMFSFGYSF